MCPCCLHAFTALGVPAAAYMPPGCLLALSLLEELNLSRCGISVFPPDALSLGRTLRLLRLAGNEIAAVPDAIGSACVGKLEELDISNNELSGLTPHLALLAGTLRSLLLEGNPLRTLRRPVLERGTQGVLAYLKDRLPAEFAG